MLRALILMLLGGTLLALTGCVQTSSDLFGIPIPTDAFQVNNELVDGEIFIDYRSSLSRADLLALYEEELPQRGFALLESRLAEEGATLFFGDSGILIRVDILPTGDPAFRDVRIEAVAGDEP